MEHRPVAVKLKIKPIKQTSAISAGGTKVSPGVGIKVAPRPVAAPALTVSAPAALKPPTPRPAPAAPPAPSPLNPLDPATEASVTMRERARQTALAAIAGQETGLQKEYYDPNDPHARQAMLKQQFQELRAVNTAQHASAGQLWSGSSASDDAFTNLDEGTANVELKRQYDAAIAALEGQKMTTNQDADTDIEELGRAARAAYAGNVDNTPVGMGDAAGAAKAATAAKPKKGYTHVQTVGPRAGLSYKVVNGMKVYENGDRMKVTP